MEQTKTDTPTTTPAPQVPQETEKTPYGSVDLFEQDSAVVFRTDKALEIISGTKPGAPITEQLFMCLLVKEFLENRDLMDKMAKNLMDKGELTKVPVGSEEDLATADVLSEEEAAPAEE